MSKSNIARTSIYVTIILVIGYFISFLKESVVANYFGVSADVDAYTIAITIPVTLFSMVSVAIQSIVIPLYSDLFYNKGYEAGSKYISNIITFVCLIAVIFVTLFEVLASPLIYLFAPGFSPETHELATILLRISLPTILFTLIQNILVGLLNVHKRFVGPAFAVYFLNIVLIVVIIVLHQVYGIEAACIGQVVGSVVSLTYICLLAKSLYRYKPLLIMKDEYMQKSLKQTFPVIWSISVAEVGAIVNRIVASFLFVGSIAALGYASKINSVFMTFFTHAIATIIYPLYSESAAKKDMEQLNSRINFTISVYSLFLLPLMVGVFCFRNELVSVAFARGAFDQNAVELTGSLLGCYSIGILFSAFRETITKVFYSMQDTATPAKNATLGVCLYILLSLTLPFFLGTQGLALGVSFTAMFISIRLISQLIHKHPQIKLGAFYTNIKEILISTSILLVACLVYEHIRPFNTDSVRLILGAIFGSFIYFLSMYLMKSRLLFEMINMFIKRNK